MIYAFVEQFEADIVTCDEEIEKVRDTIAEYKANMTDMQTQMDQLATDIEAAKQELDNENRILNAHNEEFNDLCAIYDRKSAELVELNLRVQKITHENERFLKERSNSEQMVRDLEMQYEWIADEKL